MPTLEDKSIDLILCDLPYETTACKWDIAIDDKQLWLNYNRLIKPNSVICLFACYPFNHILAKSQFDLFKYEWVWIKNNKAGHLNAKRRPLKQHENILIFSNGTPRYYPQKRFTEPRVVQGNRGSAIYNCEPFGQPYMSDFYYPTDILEYKQDKKKVHPTQKPLELLKYLIKTYSLEGETILDNTMGGGNTGVAAVELNRNFVGIEKDPNYFSIAKGRIDNTAIGLNQLELPLTQL